MSCAEPTPPLGRGIRHHNANKPMADGLLEDYSEDLELLRSAAVTAGIMASAYFRRPVKTWSKEDASPVSDADYVVDEYLHQTLLDARPDYGWLSEEAEDNELRLGAKRIFVVDPIDGTRAFLRGEDCWTICIAVVEDGVPVVGVVYAPARDELYEAARGEGAALNGKPIQRRTRLSARSGPIIPAPGAVHQELEEAGLKYVRGPGLPSLAYRLVQVATGVLDVAVARRGAQDWDIAAPFVILSECGLSLEDVCVGAPVFNKNEIRHAAIAVVHDNSLKGLVHDALRRVYGCPNVSTVDNTQASSKT